MPTSAEKITSHHNFIDGGWVPSVSGQTFENRNPANTDDLIGIFQKSSAADVARAQESWKPYQEGKRRGKTK